MKAPARRVAEKLAPSVFVALRRDKSLRWAPARRVAKKLAPSLRWAQGKNAMRPCRLDLATVRQGSIASGGCSASQGRVLRRVRGRSVLCTPMRDNLSSYVCKKIVKKVDNQQKMIQKGVLLSCSYSRSVMLLPGSDA